MKLYYDLHIHSALSPCGDMDMTPNNIVNMSIIKGLDIIAVSDHNSVGNVRSCMKVAEGKDLVVVPGMEVETSEEVHVLCLFPDIESAEKMADAVYAALGDIKNRPEIFGNQYYMDAEDEIKGEEEKLLVSATDLSIYDVLEEARKRGGIMIPAHIDRDSYSVLANLGFMPPDLNVGAVEITDKNRDALSKEYEKYAIITDSDAHYLENISEPNHQLDILNKNIENFVKSLSKIQTDYF